MYCATRPDPPEKNPTRPEQVTGRVRAEFFDPKLKKTRQNPKITHKNAGQPDPTISWTGLGPIFFDPKSEVTRPDPTNDQAYTDAVWINTVTWQYVRGTSSIARASGRSNPPTQLIFIAGIKYGAM